MSVNPRPIFFYWLSTQYENFGDLVINRECLSLLRRAGDIVVGTSSAPAAFVTRLGLMAREQAPGLSFYRQLLASARAGRPTYLVLVPGAVAGDLTAGQWLRQAALSGGYAVLNRLGVRIVRLGASMGPFSKRREQIERWKSRAMTFIGLRDRLSLAQAAKSGLAHFGPFPDFAWMLPTQSQAPEATQGPLVLSFRAGSPSELEDIAAAVAHFLKRVDPDGKVGLTIASQVERDRETGRTLAARVANGRAVHYLDADEGEAALFGGYNSAAAIVSNRLHVLLFAAAQGAPIWALVHPSRNQKIIGLFEDAGMDDRLIDMTAPGAVDRMPWPGSAVDPMLFARMRRDLEDQFARILA